jgi:hypothetical protein
MTDEEIEIGTKKHADVIKAWLDGSIIEFKVEGKIDGKQTHRWIVYRCPDTIVMSPITHFYMDWRVKPEE